jgi:hypothetical protein
VKTPERFSEVMSPVASFSPLFWIELFAAETLHELIGVPGLREAADVVGISSQDERQNQHKFSLVLR